ncbi:MAG TPA: hypothetical protein VGL70_00170 [Candidatus Binatia bacterium]
MIAEQKDTYVVKLRVRGGPRDALSLRMPFDRALSAIELQPSFLPPSAIAFIRQLRDPKPGLMQTEDGRASIALEWGRAVAAAVEQVLRRAARPAAEPVPANAEAVFFADRAELLACLAADWCDGTAITRWWWKSLFRSTDISSAVIREWLESIESVPAALAHLAKRRLAARFVRAIGEARARALLREIIERFALVELAWLKDPLMLDAQAPAKAALIECPPAGPAARVVSVEVSPPASQPPFTEWAPEALDPSLIMVERCLLGIGLMLARASAMVRAPLFARTVLRWHRAERLRDSTGTLNAGALTTHAATSPPTQPDQGTEGSRLHLNVALHTSAARSTRKTPEENPAAMIVSTPDGREQLSRAESVPADPGVHSGHQAVPSIQLEATSPLETAQDSQSDESPKPASPPGSPFSVIDPAGEIMRTGGTCIETAFGGVFYLVNLGLFLNFYGDFTSPLQPAIPLPLWDFVALVGRELVGKSIEADPAWPLLARLAGRDEHEAPGEAFDPPDRWRLPAEWLAPFSEESIWQWTTDPGRLRVKHPEQFLILDLPLDAGDPMQQLVRETQDYPGIAAFEFQRSAFPGAIGDILPQERWLRCLMPYVRARLNRALVLRDPGELRRALCEHHARVLVSGTRLDVFFALDELPIEIRLAGLDRDPGWVPATGRFIAFHFE